MFFLFLMGGGGVDFSYRRGLGLTFSSAPASCTSPSSCSLSLWIHGRGGEQEPQRGREAGRRSCSPGWWWWCYWTGGGALLGVQALEISVVSFSSFQDGRGVEFLLGVGTGGIVGLGSGDLATSQPAPAGSFRWFHTE